MHHGNDFDVLANPISDDVGNVGQDKFARARNATDAPGCWQLQQNVDSRDKAGNDPCSGSWIVVFDERTDFVKPP